MLGADETQTLPWDMFCNGMVVLHDGRVLVNGGNLQYDPFFGERRNAVYDPVSGLSHRSRTWRMAAGIRPSPRLAMAEP